MLPVAAFSNESTITLSAASNACLTARSVRETSLGKPIIGKASSVAAVSWSDK